MIGRTDVSVMILVAVLQRGCFKITPLLYHSREVGSALRIEAGIKMNRKVNAARSRRQMRIGSSARRSIGKNVAQGNVVPPANFIGIQMINAAEAKQFVQAWDCAGILEVRQAADMNDEFRPAMALRELITCLFNVTVGETQSLAHLTKTNARKQIAELQSCFAVSGLDYNRGPVCSEIRTA